MARSFVLLTIPLILLPAAVATVPSLPGSTLYEGEVNVLIDSAAAPPRCEALSAARLQQRDLDADTAAFVLSVTGPCGEFALAFRGERVPDTYDWEFREEVGAGVAPLLKGHLRQIQEDDLLFDLELGVGPCATGEVICEHPPVGGARVDGTLESLFTVL